MNLRVLILSGLLHAGVAAGVAGGGLVGAKETASTPEDRGVVEVEVAAPLPSPLEEPPPAVVTTKTTSAPAPHPHAHPYAVPGHDARPHDPTLAHDHLPTAPPAAAATEPAAPAARVVEEPRPAEGPRRFVLATGPGTMAPGTTRAAGSSTGNGGVDADAVHAPAGVTVQARLVAGATAAYPPAAREDELEGDVGLEILLDREGHVMEARVVRAGGHGFDPAAIAAIRQYRFSPAQRDGRAVRVRMPWTVQFRLR